MTILLHLLPYLGLLASGATALWFIVALADSVDAEGATVIGLRASVAGGVCLVAMMGTIIGSMFIS